jgi:glycolate oxidase
MSGDNIEKALEELSSQLSGDQILREEVDRYAYSYDSSGVEYVPDAIIRPRKLEEVSIVLEIAEKYSVPVTPRGSGTSLVGGPLAVKGGLVLDMQGMNRVLEKDDSTGIIRVEAGIKLRDVNRLINGMFLPINPDGIGFSTIGGMIAEDAASPLSVRYGTMRDHVRGLEVVIPGGQMISLEQPGPPSKRNAMDLIIGSEGTLGVITSALIELSYRPETSISYSMELNDVSDSLAIYDAIRRAGIDIYGFEVYHNYKELIEEKEFVGVEAIGFLEIAGASECVEKWRGKVESILSETALEHSEVEAEEVEGIWVRREKIYELCRRKKVSMRVVSMLSYQHLVRDIVQEVDRTSSRMKIPSITVIDPPLGWVTAIFLYNSRDPKEVERTERAASNLIENATSLGASLGFGTGVGIYKLDENYDEGYLSIMKAIKGVLDPHGIMNPEKLI